MVRATVLNCGIGMRLTDARTLGGIVSGASPAYNIEEMTYALQKAGAKYLMTVPTSMDVAAAAAKNAGIPKERVFLLRAKWTAIQP